MEHLGSLGDWQRLFRVQGLRYLICDIWMDHYKRYGTLVTVINDEWTSYLPKEAMEKTLAEGRALLTDSQAFASYESEFRSYMRNFRLLAGQFPYENSAQAQTMELLSEIARLFYYYSRTEFFATDRAYEEYERTKEPNLERNLGKMGVLKNEGRTFLNTNFFGGDATIAKLLAAFEKRFGISESDLRQYSRQEIHDLFDGARVPGEEIAKRNDAFYFLGTGDGLRTKTGAEARREIEETFMTTRGREPKDVRGTIANKGKARGTARIFKMGYDTFHTLAERMDAMQKGEILIAETTSPEFMSACAKAAAIVTDQGGLLSHAAIVSRELDVPCLVGAGNVTERIKDGDTIEVDADNGVIRILKRK